MRERVRTEIFKATSEMLDNPDELEIYPTTIFYDRMENYIVALIHEREEAAVWDFAEKLKDRMDITDDSKGGIDSGDVDYVLATYTADAGKEKDE